MNFLKKKKYVYVNKCLWLLKKNKIKRKVKNCLHTFYLLIPLGYPLAVVYIHSFVDVGGQVWTEFVYIINLKFD